MAKIEDRLFLVASTLFGQRQRAIENIRRSILKSAPSSLHIFTFYSKNIDINELKRKLFTFSFNKDKIIIFKEADALPSNIKDFLFKNIREIISSNFLILEIEREYQSFSRDRKFVSDSFFSFVFKKAKLFKMSSPRLTASLEDFKRSLRRGNLVSSLYIVEKLFKENAKEKELAMQILGILIREFCNLSNPYEKKRCLNYLREGDRLLKDKGVDSRLAVELLLIKLLNEG
jgi:hypothetical protein